MPKPSGPRRATSKLAVAELLKAGLGLHQSGRSVEATRFYEQVLAIDANQPAANHLLGVLRLAEGNVDDAIKRIARAVAADGKNAQYLGNLGVAFNAAGRHREALATFDRALALSPDFAEAYSNRGMAERALGRLAAALESYRTAIRLRPKEAGFHFNLGNLLFEEGDIHEAEAAYGEALQLRPNYPKALVAQSRTLQALGRLEEALRLSDRAVELYPDNAEYVFAQARALKKLRRLNDAAVSYRRALALDPLLGEAHRSLSYMTWHSREDEEVAAARRLFEDQTVSVDQRVHAGYGLGKALADLGDHERSAVTYVEANRLKRRTLQFSVDRATKELARLSDQFRGNLTAFEVGSTSAAPVFVLGLPRAGKTTLEHLLSGHPRVAAVGELTAFSRAIARNRELETPIGAPLEVSYRPDAMRRIGRDYLAYVNQLVPNGRTSVDTMPPNFRLIGFIRLALPHAKVIHCVRDPLSHVVGIFEKLFSRGGYEYTYDLDELVAYYVSYRRLMRVWGELFPGFIREVDVAKLESKGPSAIRELLEFCGLDDNAACHRVPLSEPQLGAPRQTVQVDDAAHLAPYRRYIGDLSFEVPSVQVLPGRR